MARARDTIANNRGRVSTSIAGLIVFLVGIGLTLFVIANPMKVGLFSKVTQAIMPGHAESGTPAAASGERKILYWYAPMDRTFISDKPGKSPMGMDLLPMYADEAEQTADNAIKIDPATVQNMGVMTDTIKRGDLKIEIRTVGTLGYNEQKIYLVNTKYDGWIQKVYVNYIGEQVRKGEPLFEIYSPDLVSTQGEYLSALSYRDKMKDSGFPEAAQRAESLLAASRNRLLYWDISDRQIEQLEETGRPTKTLVVSSPVTGIVTEKMSPALEGMQAQPGMNLYKVADLSSLWLYVDLYEYQLPWVSVGQQAQVEISYYPGETFAGKVLYFYPSLDEKTRTVKASIEVPNADGRLRPEMYATVTFSPTAAKNAVLVPDMAVLHTGKRNVVVLDLGGGRFEPRDVKLGLQGDGKYQVLEGLEGGETIVTSAQFLIDSESNLREAINKMLMAKNGGTAEATDNMEGMTQGSDAKDTTMQGADTKDMAHEGHDMKAMVSDTATIEALENVIKAYVPIWKAFAGDTTKGVADAAKNVAQAARDAATHTEDAKLKDLLAAVEKTASGMKTDDLKAARESMKPLNHAVIAIFDSYMVKTSAHYTIIECTMLKERWVQDTEAVRNPFYGSAMLTCGVKVGEIG